MTNFLTKAKLYIQSRISMYSWYYRFKKRNDICKTIPCLELMHLEYISVDNMVVAKDTDLVKDTLAKHGFTNTEDTIPDWHVDDTDKAIRNLLYDSNSLTRHRLYNVKKNIEIHLVKPNFWNAVLAASSIQGSLNVSDRVRVFCSIYHSLVTLIHQTHLLKTE